MIALAERKDTTIRHDLFAVKVFGDVGRNQTDYVITNIVRSRGTLRSIVRLLQMDTHRSYPLVNPKVTHPRQWQVNAFLAYGNHIEE